MNSKDLFNKSLTKQITNNDLVGVKKEVESTGLLNAKAISDKRIEPNIDFSSLDNFVRYGSAEKYYEDAYTNISSRYPYDGSSKEKQEWKNNSSLFDLYVFKNYPTAKGYVNFSGSEYIKLFGGPSADTLYDVTAKRESNLKIDPTAGNTVEFWFKSNSSNNGNILDVTGSNNRILVAYTGSSNTLSFTCISGSTSLTTTQAITASSWHHYAFTVIQDTSEVTFKTFIDGERVNVTSSTTLYSEFANSSLVGYIGINLTGSIDEFRYWKLERTEKEIGRYWNRSVNGGAETDDANVSLGVYYKFNEGITGTSSLDSTVIDYSGRLVNGTFVNYSSACRTVDATHIALEDADPIIRSTHPDVVSQKQTNLQSAIEYDNQNTAKLITTIPSWIVEEADEKNKPFLRNLIQIISSYFDSLHILLENLPKIKDVNFIQDGQKAFPYASKLLKSYGVDVSDLFLESSLFENVLSRNEDINFEDRLQNIKNTIYQNIYNNITRSFKTKGTEEAIRNILRSVGIDDELVKVNIYANNQEIEIKDRFYPSYIKRNAVDFFTNNTAVVIPSGSDYISKANPLYLDKYAYIPLTFEALVNLPNLDIYKNIDGYPIPYYVTSSLFGVHSTNDSSLVWTGTDKFNFRVHAIKTSEYGNNGYFHLSSSIGNGFVLTSSEIQNLYSDSDWNISVRFYNNKRKYVDIGSGSDESDYTFEFSGFNSAYDTVINQFIVTSSVNFATGSDALYTNKAFYVGAERNNFTGSVINSTNIKAYGFRAYAEYLSDDCLKQHSRDFDNNSIDDFTENAYKFKFDYAINRQDTLVLDLHFNEVSSSDSNGEFYTNDYAYLNNPNQIYKDLGYLHKTYNIRGYGFSEEQTVVDRKNLSVAKRKLPESLSSDDLINHYTQDDAAVGLDRNPINYLVSIEKSMYQAVSDEMLNMFSSVQEYNNLIGHAYSIYSTNYKDLEFANRLFSEKVQEKPSIEKYTKFYKWIDAAISRIVEQFIPASADYNRTIANLIENHILERNKYEYKLSTLSIGKDIPVGTIRGLHLYDVTNGLATGSVWFKSRADRTDALVDTPNTTVDNQRETLRRVINSRNLDRLPRLSNGSGGFYDGRRFLTREGPALYRVTSSKQDTYEGVIENIARTKYVQFDPTFNLRGDVDISSSQIVTNVSYVKDGNYVNSYEFLNSTGRTTNNIHLSKGNAVTSSNRTYYNNLVKSPFYNDGVTESSALTVRYVNKQILVNKFSAPGDRRENSRGMLDSVAEEYSAHNSQPFRNLYDRKQLNLSSSVVYSIDSVNYSRHKVPANRITRVKYNGDSLVTGSEHDNDFVRYSIPRDSDNLYWVSSSLNVTGSFDFCGTNLKITKQMVDNVISPAETLTGDKLNQYLLSLNGPYQNPLWKQIRNQDNTFNRWIRKNNYIYSNQTTRYKEPCFNKFSVDPNSLVIVEEGNQKVLLLLPNLSDKEYFSNQYLKLAYGSKIRSKLSISDLYLLANEGRL
jgi:hypothetical protein